MKGKFFIIPKAIADELGISEYRYGNGADGYLVNTGDLAVYGMERALENGAREIAAIDATVFANNNKKKI